MTTVVHSILVPAPIDAAWAVLADQHQLAQWRVDCRDVALVTSRQFGVGTRRRCVATRGKDKLEEITVWYEGYGYEYKLVESRQYRSWVGRMRLQEVPEGTILQWTLDYQPAGLLSRLRHSLLGKNARIDEETASSLRQFRRLVESLGHKVEDAAPRRRQTQSLPSVKKIVRSSSQQIEVPSVEEAIASAADTKPRRPEGLDEAMTAQESASAKSGNSSPEKAPGPALERFAPPAEALNPAPTPTATPAPAPTPRAVAETDAPTNPKKQQTPLPPGMPERLKATPPKGIPKVEGNARVRYVDEVEADSTQDKMPPVRLESSGTNNSAEKEQLSTQIVRPGLPPPTDSRDTGEVSIWEAFGVKAPSEVDSQALNEVVKKATGEFNAVELNDTDSSAPAARGMEAHADDEDTRMFSPLLELHNSVLRVRAAPERSGLRMKQAQQQVKLRRPQRGGH